MIRTLLHIAIIYFISSISYVHSFDTDSTGKSGISFKKLEATISSKIIHFKWEVNSEMKGHHFVIEKSLDKINWVLVKEVKSLGNHKERHTYQVSEINFSEGIKEYFRISRFDEGGNQEELDLIEVNQPILSNMLVLPPIKNTKKNIIISYDSMIDSRGVLYVKSDEGEIVYQRSFGFDEGYNRIELNIKRFEKGSYVVVLRDEFGNKITRSFNTYNPGRRKF